MKLSSDQPINLLNHMTQLKKCYLFRSNLLLSSLPWNASGSPSIKTKYISRSSAKQPIKLMAKTRRAAQLDELADILALFAMFTEELCDGLEFARSV